MCQGAVFLRPAIGDRMEKPAATVFDVNEMMTLLVKSSS
jgi:hypothetical protein